MGTLATGPAVKKPHLTKNGKKIECKISNYVPFIVRSSTTPTPTSATSSSQDSVISTENPAAERSGSMNGELRGDPLHESTEAENKN